MPSGESGPGKKEKRYRCGVIRITEGERGKGGEEGGANLFVQFWLSATGDSFTAPAPALSPICVRRVRVRRKLTCLFQGARGKLKES